MAKTRSMTRNHNHNHEDASSSSSRSRKRIMSFENNDVAPWSDLHDHVLFLVMMQLAVIDFLSFSGVCKSWRSFALSNRNTFMASRPPMKIYQKDSYCYLEDFERRSFRTIIPYSAGRICIGVTCGYLILFGSETRDFWLVDPITRLELHFPDYPYYVGDGEQRIRAVLVFSPSISRWMFVLLHRQISSYVVLFYIVGKHGWTHVHSTQPSPAIIDLHAFKGKIYTLHMDCSLRELRLDPNRKRKWTLLENKNFPKQKFYFVNCPELVSSRDNLYIIDRWHSSHTPVQHSSDTPVLELDFGKMEWVLPEKSTGEYAFFFSVLKSCAAIKPESWAQTQSKIDDGFSVTYKSRQHVFYKEWMWYFPHDCLNVNLLDE